MVCDGIPKTPSDVIVGSVLKDTKPPIGGIGNQCGVTTAGWHQSDEKKVSDIWNNRIWSNCHWGGVCVDKHCLATIPRNDCEHQSLMFVNYTGATVRKNFPKIETRIVSQPPYPITTSGYLKFTVDAKLSDNYLVFHMCHNLRFLLLCDQNHS